MRLPWCHGLLVALGACYMVAISSAQPAKKREPAAEGELKQLRQVIDEAKHERSLMDKEHRAVPVKRVPPGDKKVLKSLAGQQARSPSHKRTPHHEQGKKLQKRIFGVVLGQDYGSSKSSSPGEFNYGSSDDYNYGRPRTKPAAGYWEECQDQPGFECYYYYDEGQYYDYD